MPKTFADFVTDDGREVSVQFKYTCGTPDGYWEPGDPPEVEIIDVWYYEGDKQIDVVLTDAEDDRITQSLFETVSKHAEGLCSDDWAD